MSVSGSDLLLIRDINAPGIFSLINASNLRNDHCNPGYLWMINMNLKRFDIKLITLE
jgi:hypothetical protein